MTPPVRSMIMLANNPSPEEVRGYQLRSMMAAMVHPDFRKRLPGRHQRLAAKHSNAAETARAGEPTPPGPWSDVCIKGSRRIAKTAARSAERIRWREVVRKAVQTQPERTIKPPTPVKTKSMYERLYAFFKKVIGASRAS